VKSADKGGTNNRASKGSRKGKVMTIPAKKPRRGGKKRYQKTKRGGVEIINKREEETGAVRKWEVQSGAIGPKGGYRRPDEKVK